MFSASSWLPSCAISTFLCPSVTAHQMLVSLYLSLVGFDVVRDFVSSEIYKCNFLWLERILSTNTMLSLSWHWSHLLNPQRAAHHLRSYITIAACSIIPQSAPFIHKYAIFNWSAFLAKTILRHTAALPFWVTLTMKCQLSRSRFGIFA
jgi:hypothetical protein